MKCWMLNEIKLYLSNEKRYTYALNVIKHCINTLKHI